MNQEQELETIKTRLAELERIQKGNDYVLFGYQQKSGVVKDVQELEQRVKVIETAYIRWGGIVIGANIATEIIFTLLDKFYK